MVVNSISFLLFFAVVFIVYYLLKGKDGKRQNLWLRGRKINCVMRRFFPSSSVGDRPAPRGCTSTPDERKVTTI